MMIVFKTFLTCLTFTNLPAVVIVWIVGDLIVLFVVFLSILM